MKDLKVAQMRQRDLVLVSQQYLPGALEEKQEITWLRKKPMLKDSTSQKRVAVWSIFTLIVVLKRDAVSAYFDL